MNTKEFMELLEGQEGRSPDRERSVAIVREQIEGDGHARAYDASGDGTRYRFDGLYFACSAAEGTVEVGEDGLVRVRVDSGAPVPAEHEAALRKLCVRYNDKFKIPGLAVRDGRMVFEPAPFDPEGARFPVPRVMGMAMTTIHAYLGVPLALEAGMSPWQLLEYNEDEDDDDAGGDDDGGLTSDAGPADIDGLIEELRQLLGQDEEGEIALF